MDRLLQDLRYALASCRQRPGFAATVVLITAVGIGSNAAMFALLNATLIRPLDIPEVHRLVALSEIQEDRPGESSNVAFLNVRDLVERSTAIEALGVLTPVDRNLVYGEFPERVRGALASPELFDVLSMAAVRGRLLRTEDVGGAAVALVTESYWRSRLGASETVVGSTIPINGTPTAIVGVVENRPEIGRFEIYQPLPRVDYVTTRTNHFLTAYARLLAGTTIDQASAQATEIGASLALALPATNDGWNFRLEPLQSALVGRTRTTLTLFTAGVAAVLVIACLNVTSLMLVRASERRRELAVRGALGASRGRLLRQLLTESLTLAGLGGLLGTAMAYSGLGLLRSALPGDVPGLQTATIDANVVLFALVASTVTGLLFGTAPA